MPTRPARLRHQRPRWATTGARTRSVATDISFAPAIVSSTISRSTTPTTRPSSTARTGFSFAAITGKASRTVVRTSSAGPSSASPSTGGRMIQRSVSTRLRGMSRTKLATYSLAGAPTSSSPVPSWTISPLRMIAIRSPSRSASARSCVMKTIVFSVSTWSRQTSSCMSRRISGSSALKGSSKSITAGSPQ